MYTDLQSVASPLGQPTVDGPRDRPPSGRRGSNSRPQPWQGCALPTELRPLAPTGLPGRREQNHSRCPQAASNLRSGGRGGWASRLVSGHARVGERRAPRRPGRRPRVRVSDHGLTVGDGVFEAIKVVDGQPFALTLHLERLARSARGPRAAGARRRRRYAEGVEAVLDGRAADRSAGCGSPTPAGRRRSARAAATEPPTLVVVAAPMDPWPRPRPRSPRCPGRATSAARWPASRPRRTPRTCVALAEAKRRGAQRGGLRQPRGAPVRGHRHQRLLRRRRRAADADAGERLPGRRHPRRSSWSGTAAREVDEPIEVLAEASEIFLASTTRDVQARRPLGRPRPRRARPGHDRGAARPGASARPSSSSG